MEDPWKKIRNTSLATYLRVEQLEKLDFSDTEVLPLLMKELKIESKSGYTEWGQALLEIISSVYDRRGISFFQTLMGDNKQPEVFRTIAIRQLGNLYSEYQELLNNAGSKQSKKKPMTYTHIINRVNRYQRYGVALNKDDIKALKLLLAELEKDKSLPQFLQNDLREVVNKLI